MKQTLARASVQLRRAVKCGQCDAQKAVGGQVRWQCLGKLFAECVALNLEAGANAPDFDRQILGPASRIVPEWVASLPA